MGDTVEYILKLQDQISGTLKRIEENTEHMNKKMHESNGIVGGLKRAFVEFFAVAKIFEWGQEAFHTFNEFNESSAQLNATLASTKDAIGLTREQLDAYAESTSKSSLFSKGMVTSMQSVLATFTAIKGTTFKQTSDAVVNLATKMHEDLQSAAIQVGKAIQDPVKGVIALRRVGVNFNEAQTQVINKLVATGQAAKAQQLILKELNNEFGGSAAAAAKANPWKVMMNSFEDMTVKLGGLINGILMSMKPVFDIVMKSIGEITKMLTGKGIGTVFKQMAGIIGEIVVEMISITKNILPSIISMLQPVLSIFKVIWSVVKAIVDPIVHALKPAFEAIAKVVSMIAKVFVFLQPIIAFIGKMLGGYVGFVIKVLAAIIIVSVKFLEWIAHLKVVKLIFEAIHAVLAAIKHAISWVVDKVKSLGKALGIGGGGEDDAVADTVTDPSKDITDTGTGGGAGAGPSNGLDTTMAMNQPKEAKLTNINIKIDTLAKLNISTSTIGASMAQIKEMVAEALIGAVNNTQLEVSSGR